MWLQHSTAGNAGRLDMRWPLIGASLVADRMSDRVEREWEALSVRSRSICPGLGAATSVHTALGT